MSFPDSLIHTKYDEPQSNHYTIYEKNHPRLFRRRDDFHKIMILTSFAYYPCLFCNPVPDLMISSEYAHI